MQTRPRPADRPAATPPAVRWVACSEREFGPVGRTRHLAAPGALTTVCGASATHVDIWRGNRRKPPCGQCAAHARSYRINI